jgi:tricarballylate dehydrogenase
MPSKTPCDLIVIGGGSAALEAAIGKSTIGSTPKKSNWAVPLTRGPFRAYPITAGVTFSFGGVQVDTQARVINTCNDPIEGLYASGDIIGLFFHNYPSCTGQTRNVVFSYLAGRNAAALLGKN